MCFPIHSAGRGDFGIVPSPETTSDPRFYAVVHDYGMEKTREREEGVAEVFVKKQILANQMQRLKIEPVVLAMLNTDDIF